VQHHISDWDFLLLRAEANGLLVNVNDGKIKIAKPDTSASTVLDLAYGSSLLEFEAEMDARNQWKNVKASSWDYANQQLFQAEASESSSFERHGNHSGTTLSDAIKFSNYEMRHSGPALEPEFAV